MDVAENVINKELELGKFDLRGILLGRKPFVREPDGHITLLDMFPSTVLNYTFSKDEVHIVVKGKAEVEFYLPPLYQEKGRLVAEEGDLYLIYQGEDLTFRIISDETYRVLAMTMPH